jgi:hypothetical protein
LDVERYDKGSGKTVASGHGTGFVIRVTNLGLERETAEFLVTNRHVLDPGFGPEGKTTVGQGTVMVSGHVQARSAHRYPRPSPSKVIVQRPEPIFLRNPDVDLAMLRFGEDDRQAVYGEGQFNTFGEGMIAWPQSYEFGDVHAGTQVLIAGYPGLGGQSDATRPILVGGVVSSDPRYPAEFEGATYPGSVLCHAFSRAGMSGAPVFAAVRRNPREEGAPTEFRLGIIGVNAGHLRTMGSSDGVISHFVTSTALLEMLEELGSKSARLKMSISRAFASREESLDDRPLLLPNERLLAPEEDAPR